MKITIEGNTVDGSARSTLNVVLSGARGPAGEPSPLGVPYTGATQDVNLGEFGLLTGNLEFDTTPTNAPTAAGSMYYDDTSGTVVNILKGGNVISKIGETQHVRVYNNTGAPIAKGKVVAINGAQGQRPTIILADADSETLSKDTIGFTAEAIANGAEGFVMIAGVLTNVSTSGMVDGDTVFLSTTAGSYTNVKPEAPVHMVILGFVVNGGSGGAGQIYVKVDNGYELEELHNLKETPKTTAVDTDALLLKDSADSNLWKPFSWLNAKAGIKAHIDTFKGVAGGYASLDGGGKIPSSELPSYVDDVIEAANFAALPVTGETGKIYVTLDNNKCYRWSGSSYIEVSPSLAPAWGAITGTLSNQTDLQSALDGKQDDIILTTTGTSGAATLVGSTLNIPQYQSVLTNPVTGTGTAGQVAYFNGTSAVTGSNNLFWDAANNQLNIGGTNVFNHRLYVNGILRVADGNAVTNGAGISGGEGLFLSSVNGLNLFASSTYALRIFNATRNIAIQNGGTFTDNGQRLQVYGSTLLRGSGTTSATTALLVQNSTPTELFKVLDNGNANFGTGMYWDNANRFLGLSISSPLAPLHVASVNADLVNSIFQYSIDTIYGASLILRKSRGSVTSPSAVLLNDRLGLFGFSGYDGTTYNNSAVIIGNAEENWTNAARGSRYSFELTANGTTSRTEYMRIRNNGNILIQNGGTFTDNGQRLQVIGTSYISDNTTIGTTTSSGRLTVRGSGTTNTTNGLLIENSAGIDTFTIRDDGGYAFRNGTVGLAQTGYTTFTNLTTDRTCDANATTVEELADILGTLIEDLKTKGIISA